MCGIFGSYRTEVNREDVERCLNKLIHRGPDDAGIWNDEVCFLAHRRLAILDISSSGHQPMVSKNGRYIIVYNGEIYNFLEIRSELILKGYIFESTSDTEVLLYAYQEWKEKCLHRFNGMWAFAIYDLQKKELFLARDRFGVKPLFWANIGNGIVFASEMKAILPVLQTRTPNMKIIGNPNMIMEYEHTGECLIKEINRFPVGSYAVVDKRGIRINKWWDTLENIFDVPKTYNEQVELFRNLFMDSCKIRMRSDVTIGTALSGGLDSSATICAMAQLVKENAQTVNHDFQHAYSAVFPNTALDESYYSDQVADYLDIPYTKIEIDPIAGLNDMQKSIYLFEELYFTSPIPMMQLYGRLKNDGVTVTLDGHGADELFAGYPFDMKYALLDTKNRDDKKEVLDTYLSCFSNIDYGAYKNSHLYIENDFKLRYAAKKILGVEDRDRYIGNTDKDKFKCLDGLNRVLFNSSHNTILPTLFRNYDHYSMANGVEIRMPFMDYRIVTFAFSVDATSKMYGGYSKSIIRDALEPIMPLEVARRKSKIGFNTPIVEWMRGPWKEWMLDSINSVDYLNCNFINSKAVSRKIINVINSDTATYSQAERAWTEFMPYLWGKYFFNA